MVKHGKDMLSEGYNKVGCAGLLNMIYSQQRHYSIKTVYSRFLPLTVGSFWSMVPTWLKSFVECQMT